MAVRAPFRELRLPRGSWCPAFLELLAMDGPFLGITRLSCSAGRVFLLADAEAPWETVLSLWQKTLPRGIFSLCELVLSYLEANFFWRDTIHSLGNCNTIDWGRHIFLKEDFRNIYYFENSIFHKRSPFSQSLQVRKLIFFAQYPSINFLLYSLPNFLQNTKLTGKSPSSSNQNYHIRLLRTIHL